MNVSRIFHVLGVFLIGFNISLCQVTDLGQVCVSDVIDHIELNPLGIGEEIWWGGYGADTIDRAMGDGVSRTDFYADGVTYQYGSIPITDGMWCKIIGTSIGYDDYGARGNGFCQEHASVSLNVNLTLPVVWLDPLQVKIIDGKSIVTFSIAEQINNLHFEIEYSIDNLEYRSIDILKNDSHEDYTYKYIHNSPTIGLNYYRIKQVDLDGKYSYSNVAAVMHEIEDIKIWPNPVEDVILIKVPEDVSMLIYSHLGNLVQKIDMNTKENAVDISHLTDGVYFLKFSNDKVIKVIKN